MRTWKRADGVKVTLSPHQYGTSTLRLYEANGEQVLHMVYEYWEYAKAHEAAEAMARLVGAEEVALSSGESDEVHAEEHPHAA